MALAPMRLEINLPTEKNKDDSPGVFAYWGTELFVSLFLFSLLSLTLSFVF